MMRKIAIGLAAAVIATGGATLSASAYHGGHSGGGKGHYGGYHGGMSHYGGHMYRPGRQYGQYGHGRYRPDYWRYRHHWPHHGYYRTYGTYYGGGGSCWRWTPEGRVWVCGYGRPYGYSYHREYYRPRYGHYGPRYGHYGPRYGGGHRQPFYGHK